MSLLQHFPAVFLLQVMIASSWSAANNLIHRWRYSNAPCKRNSCMEAWPDIVTIDTLDISHVDISDLTILSGMTNLKSLSAYDNNITDVSPLASLDRMEEFVLVSNQIKDISLFSLCVECRSTSSRWQSSRKH